MALPSNAQNSLAWRVATAFTRHGKPIVLRQVSRTSGRDPLPNPATCVNPTLASANPTASTLSLNASEAVGRFVAGDIITVGTTAFTVTAQSAARAFTAPTPGFDNVPVTPAPGQLSIGAACTIAWAADINIYCKISSFGNSMSDSNLVTMSDLQVQIPAYQLPMPQPEWLLLIDGDVLSIQSIVPVYAGSTVTKWQLQARR